MDYIVELIMFLTFSRYELLIYIDSCAEKLKTKYKLRGNYLNDWNDFVKQKISKRIKYFRKHSYFYKTSKILNKENVKTFLHNFTKQSFIVPIDKAANNFSLS